ncbi:ATP-binding protein [Massilia sp. CF038]|uniref:HAMP domain-containing sensor histidine kinase n=1 Tax=Massilia sp. CF038 TaxID=1881045 RepID=UPI0009105DEB|nr:ATP-binding protein [Massilia sp. CF038]SHG64866.1 Signal transduction histidine kinase [Massilia sp. CF038]
MGRLFWKFFLAILLAQVAATIGVGATFWVWGQARELAHADNVPRALIDTRPSAVTIVDAAEVALKYGGVPALRELAARATSSSIFIIDADGHELLGRIVTEEVRAAARPLLSSDGGNNAVRRLIAADGRHFTVFVRRPDNDGAGAGREHFRAVPPGFGTRAGGPRPDQPPGAGGRPGPRLPYISLIVGVLASLMFAALLAWRFLRPIRALQTAFQAASSGDLAPRFDKAPQGRGDELVALGRDFDRMSTQLRALMDNQRRLLHDVSHELRSPLARLQAAIGLAHQQPANMAAALERIERESVRMDKLVGELLTLSRLDATASLAQSEAIAITDLVDEIAADARFEAAARGGDVAVSGVAPVMVQGSPDLLWRALENVVRNAVKHSPDRGAVEIVLEVAADKVLVQVLDQGPGVAPADLDAIFQPFYRSNPSANNIDGHGLGLAIARRVIAAHGGTIRASNSTKGGLCVTIVLPCSAAP